MRTVTTRTISGRINSDGSIQAGSEFHCYKSGTGLYSVVIRDPNFRLLSAVVTPLVATIFANIDPNPARIFLVRMYNYQGSVLVDVAFSFVVTGVPG
jgi:hypothetical protein